MALLELLHAFCDQLTNIPDSDFFFFILFTEAQHNHSYIPTTVAYSSSNAKLNVIWLAFVYF